MANSTSETGHAVNIAKFKEQIDKIVALGAIYNPSNPELTIPKMTTLWNTVNTAHANYTAGYQNAKNPINDRALLFKPINTLTTRVLNILNSTKATTLLKADAKGLGDKIRGFGQLSKMLADKTTPNPDFISKSHQSFIQKQDAFKQLADLLGSEPKYIPNETPFKAVTLRTLAATLKTANDGMSAILAPVDTNRTLRDHTLYDTDTGVIDVAQASKNYLKGLLGTKSPEYKLISAIKYKRLIKY